MASQRPYTDQYSDDDDDDYTDTHGRNSRPKTSTEIAQHDRQLLQEEEERDALIASRTHQPSSARKLFNRWTGADTNSAEGSEYVEVSSRSRGVRDDAEFLHKVEEGGSRSTSPSSIASSSDLDREKVRHMFKTRPKRRSCCGSCFKWCCIILVMCVAFIAIAVGALRASHRKARVGGSGHKNIELVSNGTSYFAPTTLYLSIDGFRADFLHRDRTPYLHSLALQGISPEYMTPSFPSVTFPNHYTMMTGLHPESHGVVGNTFYDPEIKEEFYYTHPAHSMEPKWWQAEPLWTTAEKQGVQTAVHMWPGSEAHIGDPTYLDKFNQTEELTVKASRLLELLDLPGPMDRTAEHRRPQLIAAYIPNVDADGHRYGPNSTEVLQTISQVDGMIGTILSGLEERNLTEIVNVVVVSDHGMATTSVDHLIQLEDLLDVDQIEHMEGWPHYGLRPKSGVDVEALYQDLKAQSEARDGFDVYLKDKDMPERYHFTQSDRIAPLWLMPHTHWAIVQQHEFDIASALDSGEEYHPKGIHGYDNLDPLMRAIFIARGPAFASNPGAKLPVFQNIEVYNIICDSIGVEPLPNNGTMRLPLRPLDADESSADASPSMGQNEGTTDDASDVDDSGDSVVPIATLPGALATPLPSDALVDGAAGDMVDDIIVDDEGDPTVDKNMWDWMLDTLHKATAWAGDRISDAKDWANDVIDQVKGGDDQADDVSA